MSSKIAFNRIWDLVRHIVKYEAQNIFGIIIFYKHVPEENKDMHVHV